MKKHIKKTWQAGTGILGMLFCITWATTALATSEAPTNQPTDPNAAATSDDVSTQADDLFPSIKSSEEPKPEKETTDTITGLYGIADSVVTLNANTSSDVFLAGNIVTVNGTVGNDLFAAGSTIIVNGVVNGSVRLAANEVIINGVVERNALIVANTIVLEEDSAVYGDAHLFGSTVTAKGQTVSTTIGADAVTLNGVMLGTVESASDTVTIGSNAEFTTTATVVSEQDPLIADGATGTQYITATRRATTNLETSRITARNSLSHLESRFVKFFFTLLIGIIIVILWPAIPLRITTSMKGRPGATWALGAVMLLIVPTLCVLLLFTVIGIPLALVLFFAYMLFLLFGSLATSYLLGQQIVSERSMQHPTTRRVMTLTVGLFILSMAMLTPWIGWLICILVATWGMGGIALQCQRKK